VLKPGHTMVAAGYCMSARADLLRTAVLTATRRYGSSANLVLSTGSGVNGYTLDASLGEFILTHADVRLPFADVRALLTCAAD
jgi:fructose-1,6-bisphosphatase I